MFALSRNAAELQAIKDSVAEIQSTMSGDSVRVFQDCVEVHMQTIQQGLSQMGNLSAFMVGNNEKWNAWQFVALVNFKLEMPPNIDCWYFVYFPTLM